MNAYTFAMSFFDEATHFVGVTAVEVPGESPQAAALELGALKHDPTWLRTVPALGILDDDDLDGLVIGDCLLIKETSAQPGDLGSAHGVTRLEEGKQRADSNGSTASAGESA